MSFSVFKMKHKRLLEFLNVDGSDDDMAIENIINTTKENLAKLKFDEKKWQIDPKNFQIDGNAIFQNISDLIPLGLTTAKVSALLRFEYFF
jgi:hypothetical protein